MGNQCQCALLKKQILNVFKKKKNKYNGIYPTHRMAICLTNMPFLLPLRYLSHKCWFSLIKVPDRNSPESLVQLCQQPHLGNFKQKGPVHSLLRTKIISFVGCTTPHMQAIIPTDK